MNIPPQIAQYEVQDIAISHLRTIVGRLSDSADQVQAIKNRFEAEVGFTGSYVLINFEINGKKMMYFPCKNPCQMRRSLLAKLHLGEEDFFPDVIYDDEFCIVEEFCGENWLDAPPSLDQLEELGSALNLLHSKEATGWGWLRSPGIGESESLK